MPAARWLRSVFLLAGACCSVVLSGCGPSTAEVSGAITLNGQPPKLKGMQITFIAADGRMASAVVAEDGAYQADGVPVGQVGVGFVYTPINDSPPSAKSGSKLPGPLGPGAAPQPTAPAPNPIPEKLRDAGTSNLTLKVEAGMNNVFNYNIHP